jgi:hypothetical protein
MFRSFVLETPKKFQWQLDGNHDYALETETNQLKVTDYFINPYFKLVIIETRWDLI